MELLEGDHVVAVWFVANGQMDWMATLIVRGDQALADYRFRYYRPDPKQDPFTDNDRKSWYKMSVKREWASKLEAAIDAVRDILVPEMGADVNDKTRVDGSVAQYFEILKSKPWAHLKIVPKDGSNTEPTQAKGNA